MKKANLSISMLVILTFLTLAACSAPAQISKQVSNLLPVKENSALNQAAAPTATPAPLLPANSSPSDLTNQAGSQSSLLNAFQGTLENIYTQVSPSVVNIQVVDQQQSATTPFNFPNLPPNHPSIPQNPGLSQAEGSGFVWDNQGHIVTNNHVVSGATQIEVIFSDGSSVPATLIGTDINSDLAVIKVDVPAAQLHPVTLADSTQVKVGQIAIAIGNPFGLEGTMTSGIISGVGRSLPVGLDSGVTGPTYSIPDVIQTDAPINPGNSGGVLVDTQGQVIGVTAAIESATQSNAGIGFVIPSAIVQKVVPALIQTGHYDHAWLGILGTTLTPDLAKAMNLPANQRGALVEEVTSGGPAEKAGLQGSNKPVTILGQPTNVGGDVITAIDGQPVKSMDDLIAYLTDNTEVGQKITLTILRSGNEKQIDVTLGTRPAQTPSSATTQSQTQPQPAGGWLGIQALPVTSEIAQAMNLPASQQGVLVEQVESGSPAEQAGLQAGSQPLTVNGQSILVGGDIITAVDGQPVTQVNELRSILQQDQPGQQISLTILRNGAQTDLQVTLGEQPTSVP